MANDQLDTPIVTSANFTNPTQTPTVPSKTFTSLNPTFAPIPQNPAPAAAPHAVHAE
ncbi:hypothetical protein [Lewinella sp. 4G2]|uniref:hypothetical protein n=1 Tax=Lewinella sp. 4G2 TaxID=1803372 RepID=UPI0012F770DF|nr:hypothetical protein [Lewinella sp. 4G2]